MLGVVIEAVEPVHVRNIVMYMVPDTEGVENVGIDWQVVHVPLVQPVPAGVRGSGHEGHRAAQPCVS